MADNTSKACDEPAGSSASGEISSIAPAAIGTDSSLFVINLCASIAPMHAAGSSLPGLSGYRVYQVARVEDGRTRHRLRLGFFNSVAHAESVLTIVRQQFPTAWVASLCADDHKFTRGYLPRRLAEPVPAASHSIPAAAPAPVTPTPVHIATPPSVPPATSVRIATPAPLILSLCDPPPAAPRSPDAVATQPFHVGRGLDIQNVGFQLQAEPAPASRPAPVSSPAVNRPTPTRDATQVAPATALPAPPVVRLRQGPLPELDSTQTIRALTMSELSDQDQAQWFAIQLAASEHPVNLDAMPHLDIFEAYRLYSVASTGDGKIVHSLRLGFFKEAISAEAVSGYLKTFFGTPTVLRVSIAEHTRFKDPPVHARPIEPVPARPATKVLEFPPNGRGGASIPTITMEVPARVLDPTPSGSSNATAAFRPGATGSFDAMATGAHAATAPASKSAAKSTGVATKRSPLLARGKSATTGRYKAIAPKSLSQQLLDEARAVKLSASGVHKQPKQGSLLSRLVDKLTR